MLFLLISIDLETLSLPLRQLEIVISDQEILSKNPYKEQTLSYTYKTTTL
jgi:hypothetical protein